MTVEKVLRAILVETTRRGTSWEPAAHRLTSDDVRPTKVLDDLHRVRVHRAILPGAVVAAHAAEDEGERRVFEVIRWVLGE